MQGREENPGAVSSLANPVAVPQALPSGCAWTMAISIHPWPWVQPATYVRTCVQFTVAVNNADDGGDVDIRNIVTTF